MVDSSETLERIRTRHPGVQRAPDNLNDTARSWIIPGYKGSFGFISSMSDHFCGTCNRLRLTADGQIKASPAEYAIVTLLRVTVPQVCLFDPNEVSLRDKLRAGASDQELSETIGLAVQSKKEKHAGMENIDTTTNRPMILIGG
jgi:molybdenum cofactor biosynthesis enzyme MoaA